LGNRVLGYRGRRHLPSNASDPRRGLTQPEPRDQAADLPARHAEKRRGLTLVSPSERQGVDHVPTDGAIERLEMVCIHGSLDEGCSARFITTNPPSGQGGSSADGVDLVPVLRHVLVDFRHEIVELKATQDDECRAQHGPDDVGCQRHVLTSFRLDLRWTHLYWPLLTC
jgi:hypothetical protein